MNIASLSLGCVCHAVDISMSDTPLTPPLLSPMVTGVGRLAPPPAPPARSPSTELSSRIPPPPPPPPMPPSSLRNGHLHSLGGTSWTLQLYMSPLSTFMVLMDFSHPTFSRWLWIQVPVPPCRGLAPSWWIQAFPSDLSQQREQR